MFESCPNHRPSADSIFRHNYNGQYQSKDIILHISSPEPFCRQQRPQSAQPTEEIHNNNLSTCQRPILPCVSHRKKRVGFLSSRSDISNHLKYPLITIIGKDIPNNRVPLLWIYLHRISRARSAICTSPALEISCYNVIFLNLWRWWHNARHTLFPCHLYWQMLTLCIRKDYAFLWSRTRTILNHLSAEKTVGIWNLFFSAQNYILATDVRFQSCFLPVKLRNKEFKALESQWRNKAITTLIMAHNWRSHNLEY